MITSLDQSNSIIFDCDGVILQSNQLKSDAFGTVLEGYDPELVQEFVEWHKQTGGISRFEKFQVFFKEMMRDANWSKKTDKACADFSDLIFKELLTCPYIPGFEKLSQNLLSAGKSLSVNTGGSETEIREVFKTRGILGHFRAIYGSPKTKRDNMIKLKEDNLIGSNCIYFGDSKLDFELSGEFYLAFVFVSHESEWPDGEEITRNAGGLAISDHRQLLDDI